MYVTVCQSLQLVHGVSILSVVVKLMPLGLGVFQTNGPPVAREVNNDQTFGQFLNVLLWSD